MEHSAAILVQLFTLLLAAKIGEEVFRRLGQPGLVGEIIGGVIAGPAVLNLYPLNAETRLFAEIGVVLLLFQVGVQTRLGDVLRVGSTALAVAVMGVALPLVGGFVVGMAMGEPIGVRVFLAAALTATSVGITARALGDLRALDTLSGRVILGAAVIDDVLAMLILAIASGVTGGGISPIEIAALAALACAFIAAVLLVGTRMFRSRPSLLTVPEFAATPFLPGMIIMLGLAALAAVIGLAAIIGAFLAGMVVGESREREALEKEVAPVAAFFTPFFFGFIGAQVDLAALVSPPALALLALVTAVAVVTKFAGAFVGALRLGPARAALIGWGMVPRGEVGIVVAGLGLSTGAIGAELYSVVVAMAVLTTRAVPPLLAPLIRRAEPG